MLFWNRKKKSVKKPKKKKAAAKKRSPAKKSVKRKAAGKRPGGKKSAAQAGARKKAVLKKAAARRKAALRKAGARQKAALRRAELQRKAALKKAAARRKTALRKAARKESALKKAAALKEAALKKAAARKEAAFRKSVALRHAALKKAAARKDALLKKKELKKMAAPAVARHKPAPKNIVRIKPPIESYKGDKPYLFVSYSHKDMRDVFRTIEKLHAGGYHIWYDEGIEPGNEWPEVIGKAIIKCCQFMVFLSRAALASRNVRNEINLATSEQKNILVVFLAETRLSSGMKLQLGAVQSLMKNELPDAEFFEKVQKVLDGRMKG